jgi:hypothetical protein
MNYAVLHSWFIWADRHVELSNTVPKKASENRQQNWDTESKGKQTIDLKHITQPYSRDESLTSGP